MTKISILAQKIADNIDRPFDDMLLERLKSDIVSYRAVIVRREHDKTGRFAGTLVQDISPIKVISVDSIECGAPTGCNVMRTESVIPKPIRVKGNTNFTYIGAVNRMTPFTYIHPEEVKYLEHTKYGKNYPRYSYLNGYIYIFNSSATSILIRSVFADPFELANLKDCDGNTCFQDIDIDTDMENGIKSFIYKELGLLNKQPENQEIKTDDSTI